MGKKKSIKAQSGNTMGAVVYHKNLADACEEYVKIFGANKNLYRITPSMQDGCKPVQRRFLYSLYKQKNRSMFIKMSKAAGDTMAAYHPHGDASITEVGGRMANPTINNICLVEGQGNFGSYKSDRAGSARYVECRLSKYAWKCFFEDYEISNVDTKIAYTGNEEEPEYLPARYPNALFNPQLSGIGYGFSSNIMSYNITEVMETTIELIKNPDYHVFIIPDSPTGADIVDDGQFQTICDTGVGTVTLRGTIEVDEINNTLIIKSIPLQTTIDDIIKKIVELKDKKVFDEILEIKDYTKNENGVKTILYLAQSANPYKTIEKLYKKNTGLKKTYSIGIKMIDDYEDRDYGVKSFLLDWIEYRRDMVRSSFNTKLVRAMEENNINNVLLFILNENNAETTTKIAKESEDSAETAKRLIETYGMDSQQADVIANMKMSALNKSSYRKYQQRKVELLEEMTFIEEVLDDDSKIDEVIISQLKEGIELFGQSRKSKVVVDDEEEEILDTDHIVAVSKDGYVKKVFIKEGQIGQVGNSNGQYGILKINNKENLLVFDSHGNLSKIPVSSIPDMSLDDVGILLERFFPVSGKIISVLVEPSKSILKKMGKNVFFAFLTKKGFVKKTLYTEFSHINGSMLAVKLPEDDRLVAVEFVTDNTVKDMVIYTDLGNGIRRDINEFPVLKANSRGVRQITMSSDEYCVGFDKIDPKKSYMFYITSTGKAKLTDMKYFPTMKRKDEVLSLINLDKKETLVGIHSVSKNDSIIVYKKHSQPETLDLKNMKVSTRLAKAEKVVKTGKGDSVLSYSVIVSGK